MTDEALRTFATFDSHGGKVSKRVEVLADTPRPDGLVAVRGPHPLGAVDEEPVGTAVVGWVDPAELRDWYRPDRIVVPLAEARSAGLVPGLFADSRSRGRVRIDGLEGHLGPDDRPAFRTLAGPGEDPVVDAPLPREDVVRIVSVADEPTGMVVVTTPVSPILPPGVYPDRAHDRPGLPPAPDRGRVRVRAFSVSRGERSEIERVDERANTMWIAAGDGRSVPVAVNGIGPDLVRYTSEPA
jgi:hypothetical protein